LNRKDPQQNLKRFIESEGVPGMSGSLNDEMKVEGGSGSSLEGRKRCGTQHLNEDKD
jgi:hypothetical protein